MEKFYITSPIYYVNDRPHVGHAYTTIAADTLARYERLRGKEVIFLTGTDENSQKTIDAAAKSGEDAVAYTDRLAALWRSAWEKLGVSNTDFIRTTEPRHLRTVQEFWKRLLDSGDIYKGVYKGLYCRGHEAFMKESDLVDELCPDHQIKPETISEENYFFRLSKYQQPLLDFYAAHPDFVTPEGRYHEVKSFVRSELEDISISRETQKWGIPVPNDPSHVTYVWFDALINYVSAVGIPAWEQHPTDVHAIGKDIVRFHAVIWPAMLLSARLPLPRQIITNGFFTVGGVKISKSLGNAIDPIGLSEKYGVDALRYFLLREIPYGGDGDFSEAKLAERYNAHLANGLGNFAARVLALAAKVTVKHPDSISPLVAAEIAQARERVARAMEQFLFHEAMGAIWALISFGDTYVNEKKPWETNDAAVIADLVAVLDNLGALLAPFLPATAEKITQSMQWSENVLHVQKGAVLFPRIS